MDLRAAIGASLLVGLAACKATTGSGQPTDTPTPERGGLRSSASPTTLPAPAAPASPAAPAAPVAAKGKPSCVDDGEPYSETAIKAHLARLASPDLDGRAPGTAGDTAARTYIAERFRCLGLVPAGKDGAFEQPFVHDKAATANVIAYRKGSDDTVGDEIVLVGAHHDHLGNGYLGANDNASGVAGLLAIAQAVAKGEAPRRTVTFVTFGAEEAGLVGSMFYAANPPAALPMGKVVQYVNLDMIGSHASRRVVYAFGAFVKLPARTVLGKLEKKYPKLVVGLGGHSVRGDQVSFCKAGIPYVFFWTPDARCYHEKCDTIEGLDMPRMVDIAALAGGLVTTLSSTETDLAAAKSQHGCRPK